jgi:hypothetical protein
METYCVEHPRRSIESIKNKRIGIFLHNYEFKLEAISGASTKGSPARGRNFVHY